MKAGSRTKIQRDTFSTTVEFVSFTEKDAHREREKKVEKPLVNGLSKARHSHFTQIASATFFTCLSL